MIGPWSGSRALTRPQAVRRALALCGILTALVGLRCVNPDSLSWIPLQTSCGAVTGLPCILCGTTRAIHHLLHAHFAQALYFNWLAFPIVLAASAIAILAACELVIGTPLLVWKTEMKITPRLVALGAGGLAALWVLQISLAVSGHKSELLNPAGPLYGLFVK